MGAHCAPVSIRHRQAGLSFSPVKGNLRVSVKQVIFIPVRFPALCHNERKIWLYEMQRIQVVNYIYK